MNATATIQIRIDEKTKRKARKTLEEMGLALSSGIKLFLHHVAITQSVPLTLFTENGFTLSKEQEILRNVREAEQTGKRDAKVDQMMDNI